MDNLSIHYHKVGFPPGKWRKRDTCKTKSRATIARAIAGIQGHLKNHPNDAMSRVHLAKLERRS